MYVISSKVNSYNLQTMWKCATGSMNSKHMFDREEVFQDILIEGSYLDFMK